jgi:transposase
MKGLINIKYWIFDLDNTLYSGQSKVFEQVDKKMSAYISKKLSVDLIKAKEIQKNYLLKHFSKPKLVALKQIAIDEISIGRKHNYLTIVLDLKAGAIVFIGDGKGSDSLEPFWKKLHKAKAYIEAVAIDMSPAYTRAVRSALPKAVIVFDHFHIIKYYNDKLTKLRQQLYHETTGYLESQALKGLRWIL